MTEIVFQSADGSERTVEARPGQSVMEAAIASGIDGIVAECGGAMSCATCHVYVEEGLDTLPARAAIEDDMLDFAASPRGENSRLSCQLFPEGKCARLVVRLPESQV